MKGLVLWMIVYGLPLAILILQLCTSDDSKWRPLSILRDILQRLPR